MADRSSVVVMLAWPMISWSIFGGYPAWKLRRGGVPEVVDPESGAYACLGTSGQENAASPVGEPDNVAASRGEDEIFGLLALNEFGDLAGEEDGGRAEVTLRRTGRGQAPELTAVPDSLLRVTGAVPGHPVPLLRVGH